MKEISKLDNIGCFFEQIGKTIQKLDDNFANEYGDVNVKGIAEILKLAGFGYQELKSAYETCLGKEFNIELGNDVLETLLKTILEILPKPKEDSPLITE
jgi:hypothetical protein